MAWRQLGGLDQDGLQMFVALFGNGPALFFAGGILLSAGQPAIADRLPDGGEALLFSDCEKPGSVPGFDLRPESSAADSPVRSTPDVVGAPSAVAAGY